MKPGKPLERHTPLRAKAPMSRKTPFISRCELTRRIPLRAVSDKRKAQQPERTRRVNALREAQAGRCARCGERRELHGHERLGMAQGASYVHPDIALCDPCNRIIEDKPIPAAWNGWKISSKHPHDPALWPWEARALDGSIVDFSDPSLPLGERVQ